MAEVVVEKRVSSPSNAGGSVRSVLHTASFYLGLGTSLQRLSLLQQANQIPHPVLVANNNTYWKTIKELQLNLQVPKYTKMSHNLAFSAVYNGVTTLVPRPQSDLGKFGVAFLGTAVGSLVAQPISVINIWQTTQYIDHGFLPFVKTWKRIPKSWDLYAGIVPGIFANFIETSPCLRVPAVHSLQTTFRKQFNTKDIGEYRALTMELVNAYFKGEDKSIAQFPKRKEELTAVLNALFVDKVAEKIVELFFHLLAYPLNTLRNRLDAQGSSSLNPTTTYTFLELVKKIYNEEGISGFYKGVDLLIGQSAFDFAMYLFIQGIFRLSVQCIHPEDKDRLKQFYIGTAILDRA